MVALNNKLTLFMYFQLLVLVNNHLKFSFVKGNMFKVSRSVNKSQNNVMGYSAVKDKLISVVNEVW